MRLERLPWSAVPFLATAVVFYEELKAPVQHRVRTQEKASVWRYECRAGHHLGLGVGYCQVSMK